MGLRFTPYIKYIRTYGRITNHNVISAVVCVVKQVIVHRTWIRLVFVIRGEEDGVCKMFFRTPPRATKK